MRILALIALGALVLACNKEQKDSGGTAAVAPSASAAASAAPAATATAGAVTSTNACSLATEAELGALVGAKLKPGTASPGVGSVSVCTYDSDGGTASLTVRTETIEKAGYEATVAALAGGEKLTGLGDDAYFHLSSMGPVGVGSLLVYKGKTLLNVTYGDMKLTKEKALPVEKKVAEKLLAKL